MRRNVACGFSVYACRVRIYHPGTFAAFHAVYVIVHPFSRLSVIDVMSNQSPSCSVGYLIIVQIIWVIPYVFLSTAAFQQEIIAFGSGLYLIAFAIYYRVKGIVTSFAQFFRLRPSKHPAFQDTQCRWCATVVQVHTISHQ